MPGKDISQRGITNAICLTQGQQRNGTHTHTHTRCLWRNLSLNEVGSPPQQIRSSSSSWFSNLFGNLHCLYLPFGSKANNMLLAFRMASSLCCKHTVWCSYRSHQPGDGGCKSRHLQFHSSYPSAGSPVGRSTGFSQELEMLEMRPLSCRKWRSPIWCLGEVSNTKELLMQGTCCTHGPNLLSWLLQDCCLDNGCFEKWVK